MTYNERYRFCYFANTSVSLQQA